jgi:hypothetical protein
MSCCRLPKRRRRGGVVGPRASGGVFFVTVNQVLVRLWARRWLRWSDR